MVGRSIRKLGLWFALLVILAVNIIALLPISATTPEAQAQTESEIKAWFQNTNLPDDLPITILNSQGDAPRIGLPGDETNGRPNMSFRLIKIHSVGALNAANRDWVIFEAYNAQGTELIKNLYLRGWDQNPRWAIYYSEDRELIKQGGHISIPSLGAIQVQEENNNEDGRDKTNNYLFRHLFNDAGSDKNCAGGTVVVSGPKAGSNGAPTIVLWHRDNAGYARELNGNCLNIDTDKDKSWAAFWGVEAVQSEALKSGGCGLTEIVRGGIGAIGDVMTNIIACIVTSIFDSVIGPIVGYGKDIGGETDTLEKRLSTTNDPLVKAWKLSLSFINIIVILALLAIAFANILHLNINTYAAKKALPGLVLGVIGANASLLLVRFVLDVGQAVMQFGYDLIKSPGLSDLIGQFISTLGVVATSNTAALVAMGFFALFIVIVFTVYFLFLIAIFIFFMIKRLVFIYALVVLAPLAFVAYGIPSMQQWFAKWWDTFIRQVFVLPIIVISMALLVRYAGPEGFNFTEEIGTIGEDSSAKSILYAILLLGMATMILKLPGLITKGALDVSNAAKKAFGYATKAPTTVYGWGQGGMGNVKKRFDSASTTNLARAEELTRKAALRRAGGNIASANILEKEALRYHKKGSWQALGKGAAGYGSSTFGGARGRAYMTTNPGKTIGGWWEMRAKAGEKASNLEAVKVNAGVPFTKYNANLSDMVAGAEGGYVAKLDIANSQVKEIKTIAGVKKFLTDGPVSDITKANEAYEKKLIAGGAKYDSKGKIISITDEAAQALAEHRAEIIEAIKNDKVQKIVAGKLGLKGQQLYMMGSFVAGMGQMLTVIRQQRGGKQVRNLVYDWDNIEDPNQSKGSGGTPTQPFGSGSGSPSSYPVGGSSVTINANQVAVNAGRQVNPSDPAIIGEANELRDLASLVKPIGDQAGRDAQHASLETLSTDWRNFAGLADDERKDLKSKTELALQSIVADGDNTLRQGADRLLAGDDEGSANGLADLTSKLAVVAKLGDQIREPESLEKQIAHTHTLSGDVAAANQAGGQISTGLDTQKMLEALNSQPEQFAQQIEELIGPHYSKMMETLGKQGSGAELKNISNAMIGELRNTISGRGPRSLPRLMQNWVANMGTSVAKHVSYAQSNQPEIKVNVEPGKPPVIAPNVAIQPPPTQAGGSTTINNTISNQTTEISGSGSAPSVTSESIAKQLGEVESQPGPTETPSNEPPANPS